MKNYSLFLLSTLLFIAFYSYSCKEKKSNNANNHIENKKVNTIISPETIEPNSENTDTLTHLFDNDLLNTNRDVKSVAISFNKVKNISNKIVKTENISDSVFKNLLDEIYNHVPEKTNISIEHKREYKKNNKGKITEIKKYYSNGIVGFVNYKYNDSNQLLSRKQNLFSLTDKKGNLIDYYGTYDYNTDDYMFIINLEEQSLEDTIRETSFKYNKEGKLTEIIYPKNSEFLINISDNSLKHTFYWDLIINLEDNLIYAKYKYNKNLNIDEINCYNTENNIIAIIKSKYNKKGKLIKIYKYDEQEQDYYAGDYSYPEIYYFYNKNKLARVGHSNQSDEYNNNGNLINSYYYCCGDNSLTYYRYDNIGNLINIFYDLDNSEPKQTFIKYNKENKKKNEINIFYSSGNTTLNKSIFKYDNKKRILSETFLLYNSDSEYSFSKKREYSHNKCFIIDSLDFGNIKKTYEMEYNDNNYSSLNNGSDFNPESDTTYNYLSAFWIENNNIIKNIIPEINISVKYEYDNSDNWIKKTIYSHDKAIIIIEREIKYFNN